MLVRGKHYWAPPTCVWSGVSEIDTGVTPQGGIVPQEGNTLQYFSPNRGERNLRLLCNQWDVHLGCQGAQGGMNSVELSRTIGACTTSMPSRLAAYGRVSRSRICFVAWVCVVTCRLSVTKLKVGWELSRTRSPGSVTYSPQHIHHGGVVRQNAMSSFINSCVVLIDP